MSWWHAYWSWAGSNIGAMPAETIIAGAVSAVFRRPIAWYLTWFRKERTAELARARADAAAAKKIAADLYEHVTGRAHPDAPAGREPADG